MRRVRLMAWALILLAGAPGMATQAAGHRTAGTTAAALPFEGSGPWQKDVRSALRAPHVQFEQALRLERTGYLLAAARAFRRLQAAFPFAPQASHALVRAAEAHFRLGEYERARRLLNLRNRFYADALSDARVEKLYLELGEYYLDQARQAAAKNKETETEIEQSRGKSLSRAEQVLDELHSTDRFGRFADRALYLMGQVALEQRDWHEAQRRFERLLNLYKYSRWRPEALAQKARCLLEMNRHPERSSGRRKEALNLLDQAEIEAGRPLELKTSEIRERLHNIEAERWWRQGQFYKKLGKLAAARSCYRIISKEYPTSKRAAEAQSWLESLRPRRKIRPKKSPAQRSEPSRRQSTETGRGKTAAKRNEHEKETQRDVDR